MFWEVVSGREGEKRRKKKKGRGGKWEKHGRQKRGRGVGNREDEKKKSKEGGKEGEQVGREMGVGREKKKAGVGRWGEMIKRRGVSREERENKMEWGGREKREGELGGRKKVGVAGGVNYHSLCSNCSPFTKLGCTWTSPYLRVMCYVWLQASYSYTNLKKSSSKCIFVSSLYPAKDGLC